MKFIVAALDCEVRPLIDRFQLCLDSTALGFRVYQGDDISVVASGVGLINVAAATAYLQALHGNRRDCAWLNLGIGGHRDHAIGSVWLAHQVELANNDRRWYPPLAFDPPCPSAAVRTAAAPVTDYPELKIYDMEAAGFYPTACRFASAELVQVIKIISDNAATPAGGLDPHRVGRLIGDRLDVIEQTLEQTGRLARRLQTLAQRPRHYQTAIERWHCTATQRHQMEDLLRRWQLLCPGEQPPLDRFDSAKAAIGWLRQRLADLPLRLA